MEPGLRYGVASRTRAVELEFMLSRMRREPQVGAALLHDRFAVDVNRLVWHVLGDDQNHDDLVQQVFVRLVTLARRVQNPEMLGVWVRTVTVGFIHSELRKRYAPHVRRQSHPPERVTDGVDYVERGDLRRQVYAALDAMPPLEHLVFVLRYVEEYSLEEVAKVTRNSRTKVKRHLRRAETHFASLGAEFQELVQRLASSRAATGGEPPSTMRGAAVATCGEP